MSHTRSNNKVRRNRSREGRTSRYYLPRIQTNDYTNNSMVNNSQQFDSQQLSHQYIMRRFLEILNAVRVYHWSTISYTQHVTTNQLYTKLEKNIDRFMEVMEGKERQLVDQISSQINLYVFHTSTELQNSLFEFREFLVSLNRIFDDKQDADIFAIRDDMLADISQHLYLLTMK